MDRLRSIEIFIEVAQQMSFSAAAQRLGIAKSNVTKHVMWLEKSLGVQLLTRTTKSVSLTEAGLSLHAARIANSVAVAYTLPRPMAVTLTLVDARGRTAAMLARVEPQEEGAHLARAESVRPGSYVCVLRAGDTVIESAPVTVPR